jgi:hypothetical protein
MKKSLMLINLCLAMCGVGQVWLVQVSSYPLWAHVGEGEFRDYHIAWWHSIWFPIFIPVGLSILCTMSLFWFRPGEVSRASVWSLIIILILTYGLTTIWWAPLMALIGASAEEIPGILGWAPLLRFLGLENYSQGELMQMLLSTHWLRLALVTLYGILIARMTFHSFHLKQIR